MRLLIQIPCLNEAQTLPSVLDDLPDAIPGVDEVDILVIDDGSTDATANIAEERGCIVIKHRENRGLGQAFQSGVDYMLEHDYDVLVNTDGDNQYKGKHVEDLLRPIQDGEADIVIGDRQPTRIDHFSSTKQVFQGLGSWVTRQLTGVEVNDAVSGFRAYRREALQKLTVTTEFSYVLDTLMQAAEHSLSITTVPVETNPPTRESRLFSSISHHIVRSGCDLLRLFAVYKPLQSFSILAAVFALPGGFLAMRFIYFFLIGQGSGHVQSLIATAILLISAVILFMLGVIGELNRTNRKLLETIIEDQRR